jgi:hypothetical protein
MEFPRHLRTRRPRPSSLRCCLLRRQQQPHLPLASVLLMLRQLLLHNHKSRRSSGCGIGTRFGDSSIAVSWRKRTFRPPRGAPATRTCTSIKLGSSGEYHALASVLSFFVYLTFPLFARRLAFSAARMTWLGIDLK